MPASSSSTSDADYGPAASLDSSLDGRRDWQRSGKLLLRNRILVKFLFKRFLFAAGSSASIQSWASSLSADSQSEETAAEFMKMFVPMLFESPFTIDQEQKATFGQMVLVSLQIFASLF